MTLRWKIAQFFEKLWWKRYLKTKDEVTYLNWKKDYWIDFNKKANIEMTSDDVILDAGCGPAGLFIIAEDQQVDAIDPLLDYYASDIDHFKKEMYPAVNFQCIKLEDIDAQKKYSKIFCLNVINHVENLEAVVSGLIFALKDEGEMYVSIDAHNYSMLKKIFQLLPGDILHPHQYDLSDYCAFFEKKNMQVTEKILFDENFIFNYYLLKIKKNKSKDL